MKPLTKSEFIQYVNHPAWLWLKRNEPERLIQQDRKHDSHQLQQGVEFEALAEQRFTGLMRLGFTTDAEYQTLPRRTQGAIDTGASFIAQGRFEAAGLTCIVDVLEPISKGAYNLYEIKASTRVKTEHVLDLAYQVYVLEKAGYPIEQISIVLANKAYRRNGSIDVNDLTIVTNLTDTVRKRVSTIEPSITDALIVCGQSSCPKVSAQHIVGSFSNWLELYTLLAPKPLPSNHVYHITRLGKQRAQQLNAAKVSLIENIPSSIHFTGKQQQQIKALLDKKAIIDKEAITAFVSLLDYPLYFLDYETFSNVIPPIDGVSPYQQVPFQYSLHRLDEDGTLSHFEYLHKKASNPVAALTASLQSHIGEDGSILVWNDTFEKT